MAPAANAALSVGRPIRRPGPAHLSPALRRRGSATTPSRRPSPSSAWRYRAPGACARPGRAVCRPSRRSNLAGPHPATCPQSAAGACPGAPTRRVLLRPGGELRPSWSGCSPLALAAAVSHRRPGGGGEHPPVRAVSAAASGGGGGGGRPANAEARQVPWPSGGARCACTSQNWAKRAEYGEHAGADRRLASVCRTGNGNHPAGRRHSLNDAEKIDANPAALVQALFNPAKW